MARTIFLFIRGLDQTGRAFGSAQKNMSVIQKMQAESLRRTYRLIFGAAAFALGINKTTQSILGLMERSTQGSLVVDDLNRSIENTKDIFGEEFSVQMTPLLENFMRFVNEFSGNPANVGIIVTATLALGGIAAVALGTMGIGAVGNLLWVVIGPILEYIGSQLGWAVGMHLFTAGGALAFTIPLVVTVAAALTSTATISPPCCSITISTSY